MPVLSSPVRFPAHGPAMFVLDVPDQPVVYPVVDPHPPIPLPPEPGQWGTRWGLAISDANGAHRGALYDFEIEDFSEVLNGVGQLHATGSTSSPHLRACFGDGPTATWRGQTVASINPVAKEATVTRDGADELHFIIRDPVEPSGGKVTITGRTLEALTGDRVIGPAGRDDKLLGRGSFEATSIEAVGWRTIGDGAATITTDAVRGTHAVSITGTPGSGGIEAHVHYTSSFPFPYQSFIRATAYVKVPSSATQNAGLITVMVANHDSIIPYYPDPAADGADPLALIADDNVPRGVWTDAPVNGAGMLPPSPMDVEVWVRLFSSSATDPTLFDDVQLIRRDSTSTVGKEDLIRHILALLVDAQHGRGHTSWNMGVDLREPTGTVEQGVWLHEDHTGLSEAISTLTDRDDGPDVWVDARRQWVVEKRRGTVREDVAIQPHDALAASSWSIDPGAQRSVIIGLSAAGGIYGGTESGATDTSGTAGATIETTLRAPNNLIPNQLDAWTQAMLARYALKPATVRVTVPGALGRRIGVGDSLWVTLVSGSLMFSELMRVTQRIVVPRSDTYSFDLGLDALTP